MIQNLIRGSRSRVGPVVIRVIIRVTAEVRRKGKFKVRRRIRPWARDRVMD